MNSRKTLITGAILGGLSVAIGAFGAHGLESMLEMNGRIDTFETAVKYQFYHSLALVLLGLLQLRVNNKSLRLASVFFLVGVVLFSGSLYILCLTNITILGVVTPFGGLAFIAGWLMMAIGISKGLNNANGA